MEPDGESMLAAAQRYGRMLAASTDPTTATINKRQIVDDLLRHDPAASVVDSLRPLDDATGADEHWRRGTSRRRERSPNS